MQKTDIVIIGQGLAGTLLSYKLETQGISSLIIDNQHRHSASLVAAGLMDSISGMRLTLAWNARKLIPFAQTTYAALENITATPFFNSYPAYRVFATQQEQEIFEKKKILETFKTDYGPSFDTISFPYWKSPFGGVETLQSYILQTYPFLNAMRTYFKDKIITESFDPKHLTLHSNSVQYKHIVAKKIIFCIGDTIRQLPWFSDLPFRPAKGETLTCASEQLTPDTIMHFGKWLAPYTPGLFRFGATYEWDDLSWNTTPTGKTQLIEHLHRFYKGSIEIVQQQAGVRCMVKDLRPIVGFHPSFPNIGVFGALSSKGVMSAPYYADQFAKYIAEKGTIDPEVNLSRLY